jgi:hypothetical protein
MGQTVGIFQKPPPPVFDQTVVIVGGSYGGITGKDRNVGMDVQFRGWLSSSGYKWHACRDVGP